MFDFLDLSLEVVNLLLELLFLGFDSLSVSYLILQVFPDGCNFVTRLFMFLVKLSFEKLIFCKFVRFFLLTVFKLLLGHL